jgi:hypothetical protein
MPMYRSSSSAPGRASALARYWGASSPAVMDDDPRLPRVGELVALHRADGARLWVGRVGGAYDKAVSVAFDAVASRPAEPLMPQPGERVELSGLAGSPIDASGAVRGHKDAVVLLRDVTASEERPARADVSVRVRGRVWCEDRDGTGCGVDVLERFPDGLCISAPDWARPGIAVGLAGALGAAGRPLPALVVACREGRHRRAVAHVAFLVGESDARLTSLLAGLSEER